MFMTPGESLAPWVLLLEQESYLPYTKKLTKKILQTIEHFQSIRLVKLLFTKYKSKLIRKMKNKILVFN